MVCRRTNPALFCATLHDVSTVLTRRDPDDE